MFDSYRDLFLIHGFNFSLRGTLGFSVLRFWLFLDRFFGFCAKKTSVFSFWSPLRIADFRLACDFRFSRKILTGFRI